MNRRITQAEKLSIVLCFKEKWANIVKDYSEIIILNNLYLEAKQTLITAEILNRILVLKNKWSLKYKIDENHLAN